MFYSYTYLIIISYEIIFIVFLQNISKPFLRNKIDPMPSSRPEEKKLWWTFFDEGGSFLEKNNGSAPTVNRFEQLR